MDLDLKTQVGGLRSYFVAFEHRNFRLLWAGRFSSNMGRMMRVFLRGWVVWQLTDSTLLMGVVISSLSWPMLFMPFIGGVVADRVDRRKLLIVTETLLVILWAVVSLLLTLNMIEWWHFVISSVASGVIQSFGRPGHLAMVADVVDKETLPNAVALDTSAQTWPGVTGPAIGVLLIPVIGVAGGFWLTTATQLITVITILKLDWTVKEHSEEEKSGARSSMMEGFRYVAKQPVLLGLFILGVLSALFAHSYNFLLPVFADEILGLGGETAGVQGLGMLMSASGVGGVIGLFVIASFGRNHQSPWQLGGGAAAFGVAIIGLGFAGEAGMFEVALLLAAFAGALYGFFQIAANTMMNLLVPTEYRGRVMGLRGIMWSLSPLGALQAGLIASFVSTPFAIALGGVAILVVFGLAFALSSELRNVRALVAEADAAATNVERELATGG